MQIAELEARTGLGRNALRYYERRGLLGTVPRIRGNYRDYPEKLVGEIRLLRSMQSMGFSLDEIRSVLDGVRARDINCADGARLVAEQRERIDKQISGLREVSRLLAREQKRLEANARRHGVALR